MARSSARKTLRHETSDGERANDRSSGVGSRSHSSRTSASGGTRTSGRCTMSSANGTSVARVQLASR